MSTELEKLMEDYAGGLLTRREFFRRSVMLTGSLAAAHTVFGTLLNHEANAAMVSPNDPDLLTHEIEYSGKSGAVMGYLARPAAKGTFPGLILIHQNSGLDGHVRDVARRLAKDGYVVLAPDYLSHKGGTAKINPKGGGIKNFRDVAPAEDQLIADTRAGYAYLKSLADVRANRLGVVGFCWGGGMAFATATQVPEVRASVIYYGDSPQPIDAVKNLRGPLLAHYAEDDNRINKDIPATEKAMKQYNKSYAYKIFPGTKHAFNDDTRADRYIEAAAKEAWGKTLEFFAKNLKG